MKPLDFYKGKRVLVTGHTGFKGIWLAKMLQMAGADLMGYALLPATEDGREVLHRSAVAENMHSVIGDIRDYPALFDAVARFRPEIVMHLAAQPIVGEGYRDPVTTYATNVMGTVHILECVRNVGSVRSFLNVTTDKVYEEQEWPWGYRETDSLDGFDPYSNSKSCSELVTHCYRRSYFSGGATAVSTARAGNVIGGGDFSPNRIVPDCVRAAYAGEAVELRNMYSVRPYQHVLEPLWAYLVICKAQYEDASMAGYYNVGPDESDCVSTGELANLFCKAWGNGMSWAEREASRTDETMHESNFLRLDCSKLRSRMGWRPRWNIVKAVGKTVEWAKVYRSGGDIGRCMAQQIRDYFADDA